MVPPELGGKAQRFFKGCQYISDSVRRITTILLTGPSIYKKPMAMREILKRELTACS
jgi:hypothetical protein